MKVLGIVGRNGAGKDSVLDFLKQQCGIAAVSSGDIVRDLARRENIKPTRNNLQQLAQKTMRMEALNIADMATLKQALEAAMQREGERVVVPGLTGEPALDARYTDEGIRISPEMLEGTAFRRGDAFKLKVEGDRIVMQKTGDGP